MNKSHCLRVVDDLGCSTPDIVPVAGDSLDSLAFVELEVWLRDMPALLMCGMLSSGFCSLVCKKLFREPRQKSRKVSKE
jgi:hypothetical protein